MLFACLSGAFNARQFLPARYLYAIVDLSINKSFYMGYQMKLKKWLCSSFFAIAAIFMVAQNASAASGSYGRSAVTPTIYSKNFGYNVAYPVVGTPPRNATVTYVYYSYTYAYPRPAGFEVQLCNNAGTVCSNVTRAASGNVNFTRKSIPANQPLRLFSRVSGTGTMMPLVGGSTSVTVNYSY